MCEFPRLASRRAERRSIVVWVCAAPHHASELAEALGLSAVEAWGIAREIRQHLEADRVTEGRPTASTRDRPPSR